MPGRPGAHYDTEVTGWTEWGQPDDVLWYEVPDGETVRDHVDPADVEGLWVHAWNTDDPADEHWFWVRSYMTLNWDQWDALIDIVGDMHSMAFA